MVERKRKRKAKAKERKRKQTCMSLGLGQMSFSGKTAVTRSGRRSKRESRQSRLRASTVLHLMAARSVMNQLACDVNLTEQAELWRLEGGISRSDERKASSKRVGQHLMSQKWPSTGSKRTFLPLRGLSKGWALFSLQRGQHAKNEPRFF